jgi:diaminohydroxyphosphoribosylaminopyrimidine deaminase/5-amino-6-(5-phosphoribosylamino)uracil reductase
MMRAALALARRSLGRTWPNPAVGCVIVRDGHVVARGRTQDGGRPHAEADALAQAGDAARGATVYVTLEPCAHHGRTPPCAEALVRAGVGKVVSAVEDPDPRVKGQGHAMLRAAGIAVEVGEGAEEATYINEGFFLRVREGRPLVHLKLATSLDGQIATASGDSKWITGEAARAHAHHLRATHDGILVGAGTARADDPELTTRLPGLERYSPVRIVLDSKASLSPQSKLARTARQTPVWLVCLDGADTRALEACGVEILRVAAMDAGLALKALGARGLTRVMVEGGSEIAANLLAAGLVDRLSLYRAGLVLGGDSRSAVAGLGLDKVGSAPRFRLDSVCSIGPDTLESWRRAS